MRTKYQSLLSKKAKDCKNSTPASRAALKKARDSYIKDAVKKGKSTAEATKIAKRVTDKACPISIAGKSKRKTAKKKTTRRVARK
ncbi:MAG: hypothetical protein AAF738_05095 [Bacteroidota bacterium]